MTEPKSPVAALRATVADFMANPKMRIRADLAQNAAGRSVSPTDPDATCFCALGRYAFHRRLPGLDVYEACGELGINDTHTVYSENDGDKSESGVIILPFLTKLADTLEASTEAAAA